MRAIRPSRPGWAGKLISVLIADHPRSAATAANTAAMTGTTPGDAVASAEDALSRSSAGTRPRSLTSMPCALAHSRTSAGSGLLPGALHQMVECGAAEGPGDKGDKTAIMIRNHAEHSSIRNSRATVLCQPISAELAARAGGPAEYGGVEVE